ncbi:hypothetical protein [Desulfovibrio ferrophilus]|uniref:Metallo-beta-lactamase domain-containing protein n=1 Tax=Desulfovibrio ferrophilus TaxID=241368 RepID=A0A2Z6AWE2_9BACT|nr:hypothetical protein [Desulfovibrio ferrophilus]BBD07562.1 uncharacterized protein DFE_0836 [Desulfovibrio ferrophilus]
MTATLTFHPLGNADSTLIKLANSQLVLVDYADMCDPSDPGDKRCNLPRELHIALAQAQQTDFRVVCFTHLDEDHVKGTRNFFWLDHLKETQKEGRPKIEELWVPAAAITEVGVEDDAWCVRQEARYRLKRGDGIKVFSRPESLKKFLEGEGLSIKDRRDCIVDAGELVPGFQIEAPEAVEFFVHCPFAWRQDENTLEDRNQDSIVFQARFRESDSTTNAIFGSDVDSETLSQLVHISKSHGNEDRLEWDIFKIPHHCSYKTLNKNDRGEDTTTPEPNVKWLFETQGNAGGLIASTSKPIPQKGSDEDKAPQPPHRQAASYYSNVAGEKDGEFRVTMQYPSYLDPKPFKIEITRYGIRTVSDITSGAAAAALTPQRAG